jgi:hypothetical protein
MIWKYKQGGADATAALAFMDAMLRNNNGVTFAGETSFTLTELRDVVFPRWAAIAAAPVGNPPYESKGGSSDPYPKRTYKGRLVIPGFLKSQIRRRSYISKDKTVASVRIAPTAEAFYGVNFIEFGTAKIAKRPWLEPSFRASVPDMAARLKERLKALIDKAARSK